MIPSSRSLVTLQPARQAALQAIMTVENARQRSARLPADREQPYEHDRGAAHSRPELGSETSSEQS